MFQIINQKEWSRKPYFDHFFNQVKCTYSLTTNIDITHLLSEIKRKKYQFYPCLLFILTKVVNRHNEFKTALNSEGELGVWSEMYPCFTYFHKETEEFSNIWTKWNDNFYSFYTNYQNDIENYGTIHTLFPKENIPQNTFPVSMLPWTQFTGFNLNIIGQENYLLPIFTFGKYYQKNNKTIISLAVQVHHAVCDGFHLSRFLSELQEEFNAIVID